MENNYSRWRTRFSLRDKSFPSPSGVLFCRGRLSCVARDLPPLIERKRENKPRWTRVLLIPLDPRTTHRPIVSVRSDGAHQGNRMAAINLVRYNWTKKVRYVHYRNISRADGVRLLKHSLSRVCRRTSFVVRIVFNILSVL